MFSIVAIRYSPSSKAYSYHGICHILLTIFYYIFVGLSFLSSSVLKGSLVKFYAQDFPPPVSAGDTGSIPGPGRSHMPQSNKPHAPKLLSLRSRAREPQLLKPARLEPVLHNERGHCDEKPAHCNKEQPPPTATRESPHAATKTQRSHK